MTTDSPRPVATILYEDQRGPTKGFGLHELLLSCIHDQLGGERHDFRRRVEGIPKKGNGSLLRCCEKDAARIAADGRQLIAVFDNDKVRRLLNLAQAVSEDEVLQSIRARVRFEERFTPVLLHENLESVLEALGACDEAIDKGQLDAATREKSLLDRDLLLQRAAFSSHQDVRDCVLARIPALKAIRDIVLGLLR